MDMARSEVRKLAAEDYSTVQHLEHASKQARERNYQDFLIVDVDAHHYESESYKEVFEYIENPVIRRQAVESAKRGGRASMLGGTIGYQDIGGRITRHELRRHDIRRHDKLASTNHRDQADDAPRARSRDSPLSRQRPRRTLAKRERHKGRVALDLAVF